MIEQSKIPSSKKLSKTNPHLKYSLNWDDYYDTEIIYEFIDELAANNDFITTESIGLSEEGSEIRIIKIEKAGPGAPNVFIEAGN